MLEGHEAEDGDEGDGEGEEGQEPGAEELVEGDVEGEVVGVVGFLLLARGREEGRGLACWFLLCNCVMIVSSFPPSMLPRRANQPTLALGKKDKEKEEKGKRPTYRHYRH